MVKKAVETWKTKSWYQVYTPKIFGEKPLNEIIASEDKQLLNRVMKVSLDELTGDFSQTYTTVKLRIIDVKGKNAYTRFIGHEQLPSYVRTYIKRGKTIIDDVIDIKTTDGQEVRLKLIIFAACHVARGAEAAIRTALRKELVALTEKMSFEQLMQEIFFKRFATKLIPALKKIAPIRRIEFRKTEVKEVFKK